MVTREDIIWAAGFWEGEGSVSIRSASASQTHMWPLLKLQDVFGGTIAPVKTSLRGNMRPYYQWWISGEQARLFIASIYPLLSPRRKEQIDGKFVSSLKQKRCRPSKYKAPEVEHAKVS